MAKYLVSFQRTDNAFASNTDVPEHLWYEISQHTSVAAARKALSKDQAAMHEVTGSSAWSYNVRLVALADIPMEAEFFCENCFRAETLRFVWPQGETCPVGPSLPGGWRPWGMSHICDSPECQQVYEADQRRLYKAMEAAHKADAEEMQRAEELERDLWEQDQAQEGIERYKNHPDREVEHMADAMRHAFESGNPAVKLSKSGKTIIFSSPAYGRHDLSGRVDLARKQMLAAGFIY